MEEGDEIKELFQKELGNYKAKVSPKVWEGVKLGMNGAGASGFSAIRLFGKICIATAIIGGMTTVYFLSSKPSISDKKISVNTTKVNQQKQEEKSEANLDFKENDENADTTNKIEINSGSSAKEEARIDVDLSVSKKNIQLEGFKSDLVQQKELPESITKNSNSSIQINQSNPISSPQQTKNLMNNETYEKLILDEEVHLSILKEDNQLVYFNSSAPENTITTWDFGDGYYSTESNPIHIYEEPGEYEVNVTFINDNQIVTKILYTRIKIAGKILNLPNIFTPNSDGVNDEFFISAENILEFHITVLDKFQRVVYSSEELHFRWNGLGRDGNLVPSGDYYYFIIAKDEAGNVINKYQTLKIEY